MMIMKNKKNDIAIDVNHVTKTFKLYSDKPQTLKERLVRGWKNKTEERTVLKDINLEIKKGETVALIGVNGSGKSTLLKLMTKIIYPNKGTLKTYGKLTSLLELGAGFHPDFTGRENIYFNAAIFGLTKKEIDDRLQSIIEFSELGDFIDSPVRTYSSGMFMRLAFSVAFNASKLPCISEIIAIFILIFPPYISAYHLCHCKLFVSFLKLILYLLLLIFVVLYTYYNKINIKCQFLSYLLLPFLPKFLLLYIY